METLGVEIVLIVDVSYMKMIHQIVMVMVGHENFTRACSFRVNQTISITGMFITKRRREFANDNYNNKRDENITFTTSLINMAVRDGINDKDYSEIFGHLI